MSPLLYH